MPCPNRPLSARVLHALQPRPRLCDSNPPLSDRALFATAERDAGHALNRLLSDHSFLSGHHARFATAEGQAVPCPNRPLSDRVLHALQPRPRFCDSNPSLFARARFATAERDAGPALNRLLSDYSFVSGHHALFATAENDVASCPKRPLSDRVLHALQPRPRFCDSTPPLSVCALFATLPNFWLHARMLHATSDRLADFE